MVASVMRNKQSLFLAEARNQSYLGDDGLVYAFYVGDQTVQIVNETVEQTARALEEAKKQNKKGYVLVDISKIGEIESGGRRAGFEGARALKYEKLAVFGEPSPFLRNVASLVIKAVGLNKVKLFNTREEAVKWLRL